MAGIKHVPKLGRLETLRVMIEHHVPEAIETSRAEADLIAASFQSRRHPERHIYISFYDQEHFGIDLEDWMVEGEWDNAVDRQTTSSLDEALEIVKNWLG